MRQPVNDAVYIHIYVLCCFLLLLLCVPAQHSTDVIYFFTGLFSILRFLRFVIIIFLQFALHNLSLSRGSEFYFYLVFIFFYYLALFLFNLPLSCQLPTCRHLYFCCFCAPSTMYYNNQLHVVKLKVVPSLYFLFLLRISKAYYYLFSFGLHWHMFSH